MKKLACILLNLFLALPVAAQIDELRIGVDGLTCSQCTRSVEVKLRQLVFVQEVHMDLASTNGIVQLKQGLPFAPAAVARAVRDAGFSVRYLNLVLRNPDGQVLEGDCLSVSGLQLRLTGSLPAAGAGHWILQLQGAPYGGRKKAPVPAADKCGARALSATARAE